MIRSIWLALAVLTLGLYIIAIPLRFAQLQTVCPGIACTELQLTGDDIRLLQQLGLSFRFYATYNLALEVGFVAVHFILAFIIFARRSDDRMALFVSLMLIAFAATFTGTLNALVPRPWAWRLPVGLVSSLPDVLPRWLARPVSPWWFPVALLSAMGQAMAALFFYLFPSGRFVPRWTAVLAVLWIAWQIPAIFLPVSFVNAENWPPLLASGTWFLFLVSYVFAQIYRYRHVSDILQRQQTKWVVLGVSLALGGLLGSILLSALLSWLGLSSLMERMAITTWIYIAMLAFPLSIGAAIMRSHLWDIDVLINRALVYGLLSGTLLLVYFGSIVLLQTVLQPWLGGAKNDVLLVLSTLATAALFSPVRARLQMFIDQKFYRGKYDTARTLAGFTAGLRHQVELEKLSADLVSVVDQTMQPAHVSLWLRKTEGKD